MGERAGMDVGGRPNTMYFQYIVLGPGRGGGAGFRGRLHRLFCHCFHSRGGGLCQQQNLDDGVVRCIRACIAHRFVRK